MKVEARINPIGTIGVLALAAALSLGLLLPAQAEEQETLAPAAVAAPTPARVYTGNGVTITWNLDARRYESPTAEQASRLAAEFRDLLATKLADATGVLAPAGTHDETVMTDGTVKLRITPDLLSTSIVRLDAAGHLAGGACVDGPAEAARALGRPTATRPLEEE